MTILLLIRHGENDTIGKWLAGRTPGVNLNQQGRDQAGELADRLASLPIKAVYSSPLERTVQTAAPLAGRLGMAVNPYDPILEIDYGACRGKSFKQLRRMKIWKQVQQAPGEVRFPDGETLLEAQERIWMGLSDLAAAHPDAMVACFTHGDVIRLAVCKVLNIAINDFQKMLIATASTTVIAMNGQPGHSAVLTVNQMLRFEMPAPKTADAQKAEKTIPRKERKP